MDERIETTNLPECPTLTWQQLLMVLEAGYDIRTPGDVERARTEIREGCKMGDAFAIRLGFPYLIRKLEVLAMIRQLDNFPPKTGADDQEYNSMIQMRLVQFLQEAEGPEAINQALTAFRQRMNQYNDQERQIICTWFTHGLNFALRAALATAKQNQVGFVLVARRGYQARSWEWDNQSGGYATNGSATMQPNQYWRLIVVASRNDLLDIVDATQDNKVLAANKYTGKVLSGLMDVFTRIARANQQPGL